MKTEDKGHSGLIFESGLDLKWNEVESVVRDASEPSLMREKGKTVGQRPTTSGRLELAIMQCVSAQQIPKQLMWWHLKRLLKHSGKN